MLGGGERVDEDSEPWPRVFSSSLFRKLSLTATGPHKRARNLIRILL